MKSTKSATKVVVILATYIFAHINRVCFTVLSSDGVTRYNTCFTNGHGSCDCPARGECYHLRQLAPIAAEKLEKRTQKAAPVYEPITEQDANTASEWGNPRIYDEAYYRAKSARMDRADAWCNAHPRPIQCKEGLYRPVDEEYEQWKRDNGKSDKMSREAYCQEFAIY